MKYEETESLTDGQLLRLNGVKRGVFAKMLSVLNAAHAVKKARGGRPNKLSVAESYTYKRICRG